MRVFARRKSASAQSQRPALHAAESAARSEGHQTILHAPDPLQIRKKTGIMNPKINTLDVRPDFRSGQHPCDKIQNALSNVGAGEALRLLVPFEPVPLFDL